jgi:hypothetical protein
MSNIPAQQSINGAQVAVILQIFISSLLQLKVFHKAGHNNFCLNPSCLKQVKSSKISHCLGFLQ